jgi:hypothetical protein
VQDALIRSAHKGTDYCFNFLVGAACVANGRDTCVVKHAVRLPIGDWSVSSINWSEQRCFSRARSTDISIVARIVHGLR